MTTSDSIMPGFLEIQPLHAAFFPLIEIQLDDSILWSGMFQYLGDIGVIGYGSSFFLECDVDIVVSDFIEFSEIFEDIFYFCFCLDF